MYLQNPGWPDEVGAPGVRISFLAGILRQVALAVSAQETAASKAEHACQDSCLAGMIQRRWQGKMAQKTCVEMRTPWLVTKQTLDQQQRLAVRLTRMRPRGTHNEMHSLMRYGAVCRCFHFRRSAMMPAFLWHIEIFWRN
ncbi:MAG: hypothetical protein C0404_02315 [Verrucomicrobia bacterium]|nr:hypothetical protein [Verrucomicrobiota bacterium]